MTEKDSKCLHPIRAHGLCACCGEKLPQPEGKLHVALHSNTNLLLSRVEAQKQNEESYAKLMKEKRMVLLLDLDQTIIHTSVTRKFAAYYEELLKLPEKKESKEEAVIREVRTISFDGYKYYVKKRDGLDWFLKKASEYFEIHVYTMGNKQYGTAIADLLDKERKIFGQRIVTRDDNMGCFEKDLARLFPTNTKNVVILDDRPDVWNFSSNLLPIRPYTFFQEGDLNCPRFLAGKRKIREEKEEQEPGKLADDLVQQILRECVVCLRDTELERVMACLMTIHAEYFSDAFQKSSEGKKGVISILEKKKQVFVGCRAKFFCSSFEAEQYFCSLFTHHGGTLDLFVSRSTTHVIIASGGAYMGPPPSSRIKYVGINWVTESVYNLRRMGECDFSAPLNASVYTNESDGDTDSGTRSTDSLYSKILDDETE